PWEGGCLSTLRSVLSTWHKQGLSVLDTRTTSFAGQPLIRRRVIVSELVPRPCQELAPGTCLDPRRTLPDASADGIHAARHVPQASDPRRGARLGEWHHGCVRLRRVAELRHPFKHEVEWCLFPTPPRDEPLERSDLVGRHAGGGRGFGHVHLGGEHTVVAECP